MQWIIHIIGVKLMNNKILLKYYLDSKFIYDIRHIILIHI